MMTDDNTMNMTALKEYICCINSYPEEWNQNTPLTSTEMALAGLTYTGLGDRVKCLYCSIELDTWERTDNPYTEHQEKSPYCAFFKNRNKEQGYDECGIYNNMPAFNQNGGSMKSLLHVFNILGIVHHIGGPKFKQYSMYEDRIKTFKKCLLKMKKGFHAFVEAGFFYIGEGNDDHMSCFSCNQCLSSWDDDDDPWAEHARWSPNCDYLLLNKGQAFIHNICKTTNKINPIKLKDLSAMIDYHINSTSNKDILVSKPTTKRNGDENKILNIAEIFAKTELKEATKRQDPNAVEDSILCKICYRNKIMVSFIPCGHAIACIDCALFMDQCAICRMMYTFVIKIFISSDKVEQKELQDLACKPQEPQEPQKPQELQELQEPQAQALDKPPSDNMLCKICRINEMQLLFIPCRHVYGCITCASELHECPVCSEVICASIHIFL